MTIRKKAAGLSLGLAAMASGAAAQAQGVGFGEAPDALEKAPWNNRLLVVCTSNAADDGVGDPPVISAQYEAMLENVEGFIDRDLILVWVTPASIMSWTPVPPQRDSKQATLLIGGHDDDPTGLRDQVGCGEVTDEVTLIGKDTGTKTVWDGAAPTDEVFAAIDAMPMRRREMQDRS